MERRYSFYTFFDEVVFGYQCKDTTEAEIYTQGDRVWKVFHSHVPIYRKHEEHFDDISDLDPEMFTNPIDKLILDNEYYGFLMKNGGIKLSDYLIANVTTRDENIKILERILLIIEYLKKRKLIHGDLRLPNILIDDDGIIRLTDLNNMIFPEDWNCTIFLNKLHQIFFNNTGTLEYLDDLAFNLITYIMINYKYDELVAIIDEDAFIGYEVMCELLKQDRGCFDASAFEIVKGSLIGDKEAIKALKPNTFLIDYLK